ncbi:hypothetical protein ACFL0U_00825 [Pseudomonadota bacterium]
MKEQLIKDIKDIKNTPLFKEDRNFYITKYSIIIGILLIFALLSNIFFFVNFVGFLLLLGFLFTIDLIIIFLKRDKNFKQNKPEIERYEKILLLIQVIAFALCASDVMPYIIKSLFGASAIIAITYFTLEMIREHSQNPSIKGRKYLKYISLILLPIIFIPPFPLIFMVIYHILCFIMIPGIILTMIYIAIDIKSKVKLSVLISSFVFLYGFLVLCL